MIAPTSCGYCGTPLPIRTGAGRPRRFCSDACRYAARKARAQAVGEPGQPIEQLEQVAHEERVEALAALVDGPPAAPEDQLARTLTELQAVEHRLRRLGPELAPRLSGPTGKLANALGRELRRAFPELVA